MSPRGRAGLAAAWLGAWPAVLPQLARAGSPSDTCSPWTGLWVLDASRPEPEGAADAYRLTVGADRSIVWEIPSLDERNTGTIGGAAMPIVRHGRATGRTIRVWAEGPRVLRYEVAGGAAPGGGGRMMLADDRRSWSDVPLDHDMPVTRLRMIYAKR